MAWRAYQAALAERADTEAAAAELTVQDLGRGVRRYRDPRLDQLAARRTASPYAGARNSQDAAKPGGSWSTPTLTATGAPVNGWGQATCGASCRAHAPDLPTLPAGPAAPATGMTDRRTERGGLYSLAGAGAVPPPTVPHQGRCAGSASLRDHLTVALDPGHPAAAVSGAPKGSREEHAPARRQPGPANPPGGAR